MLSASAAVARLQTNSPVALAFRTVSFMPSLEKATIGGVLETALKKL